jgi:hypothetical protein
VKPAGISGIKEGISGKKNNEFAMKRTKYYRLV